MFGKITKKCLVMLALLSLTVALSAANGSTTIISSPAATVNLIRNHAITNEEVDREVENYRRAGMNLSRVQVLDIMINDEVFLQGAERDGVVVNDMQVQQQLDAIKAEANRNLPTPLTDEQFQSLIQQQTGVTFDEYKNALKEQMLVQMYLMTQKGDELQNIDLTVTDSEIMDFYRKNRQNFYSPESVKLAHIFIPHSTEEDESARVSADEENAALLIDVANKIKAGEMTFEEAVPKYSQDDGSKNIAGDIGWLRIDNDQARAGFGDEFFNQVMAMQPGQVSPMLESNVGYHIVKVTVHTDGNLLSIDDTLNPETTVTVREYIRNILQSQKQQEAVQKALDEIIVDLRNQARIRTY